MLTAITEEIDRLYAFRADAAESVTASISLIERDAESLCDETPGYELRRYELLWRLSRARFFLGQCAGGEAREAQAHHAAGAAAGKRATRIAPERIEAIFWRGVNLALLAQVERAWRALPLALTARSSLQCAVAIDAAYHAAGPLRVLARLESRLPAPFGSRRRAAQLFARAVELAPTNTVTRRYFAEFLFVIGDTTAAHEHLQAICAAPFDPQWEYEIKRDQRYAQERLSERMKAEG